MQDAGIVAFAMVWLSLIAVNQNGLENFFITIGIVLCCKLLNLLNKLFNGDKK